VLAELILGALAAYFAVGILFAGVFAVAGVDRLDPAARGSSTGFRILILPGSALFWPLLARRWVTGASHPPIERNAHRNPERSAR
jgi:hypothetical protein